MRILEEIVSKMKPCNKLEELRILCDRIYIEEESKQEFKEIAPRGSRILLTLEVPGKTTKEIGFITLELEDEDSYVIAYYTLAKHLALENKEDTSAKLKRTWTIMENTPEKILTGFARKLKLLKGE